ncbi:MAG: peptidylprolyl isomerase [Saprospiraceae bacterium]
MALIGEIRKRSWILIVLIGLAMGGFLLMDMLKNQTSFGNPNLMGKINGEKVLTTDFYQTERDIFGENAEGDMFERRDQVWEYMIQQNLLNDVTGKLGIDVSEEEMNELFNVGPNLSPVVVSFFGGYQQFDVQQYTKIKEQAASFTGQDKEVWDNLKDRVRLSRKQTKYNNLVSQGFYTPTWMAEMDNVSKTQKANFKFVGIPFAAADDVKVTDSDIRAFIKANAFKYKKDEETRKASYVTFTVTPTSEDSADIRNKIADLVPQFKAAENDSMFITDNYGTFEQAYQFKDVLSPIVADSIFNLPKGSVVGPYLEGRQYKAVKVVDRMVVPDSVEARHILLQPNQQLGAEDVARVKRVADTIMISLKNGTGNFDSLAVKYSGDASNKNDGGKLGWATTGKYVKPFEEFVFYKAKVGEYNTVITQFGIHIIQVTNSKSSGKVGAQVAYISEDIMPSSGTIKDVNKKAFEFVGKHRTVEALEAAAAENADITVSTTQALKASDYQILGLGGGTTSRDLIKWLFKADLGEVSAPVYTYQDAQLFYDNKFVIAGLNSKQPVGLPSVADVRAEVEPLVLNKKKADNIMSKIKAGESLDAIAGQFQSTVQEANGIGFDQSFVQGMGNEPQVIGQIFKSGVEMNKAMAPVAGNSGVFVVMPLFKSEPTPISDFAEAKKAISNNDRTRAQQAVFGAMKKGAKITDNRTRFY